MGKNNYEHRTSPARNNHHTKTSTNTDNPTKTTFSSSQPGIPNAGISTSLIIGYRGWKVIENDDNLNPFLLLSISHDYIWNPHKKIKNNSAKIFNCGHITYTGNTLKFEYLGKCTPMAANILTLLVWR